MVTNWKISSDIKSLDTCMK